MTIKEIRPLPTEALSLQGNEICHHTFSGDGQPENYLVIHQQAVDSLISTLASKIAASGQKFDIVIPVVRGGLGVGRQLADRLGDLPIVAMTVASGFQIDGTRFPPEIVQGLPIKQEVEAKLQKLGRLRNGLSRALVVEEIVESFASLQIVSQYLKEHWQLSRERGTLAIATLVLKRKECQDMVDFWQIENPAWAIFPWEVCETITGLYRRWKNYAKRLEDNEIRGRLRELGFSQIDVGRYWPGNK